MLKKVNVGIIGTGNIGTDLMFKIKNSNLLNLSIFIGRRQNSEGIRIANSLGVKTSTDSVSYLLKNPNDCKIIFEATTAKSHLLNADIYKKLNIFAIDLTPARVGKMCVPTVNLFDCLNSNNVNMITCGGQGTIPMIYAIMKVQKNIKYVEIVASIASKSAGIGTRQNIDEFTQTTKEAIQEICGIMNSKAIITLNPAEPPKIMHNTIFMLVDNPNINKIRESVIAMEKEVQKYVPGYKIVLLPIYENNRLTMSIEVTGKGDYLPTYAGNLDIITSASINVAEEYAKLHLKELL